MSSIFGGSDCTLARSTFNLVLVCAWALEGGGPGDCGGWGGPPCGCGPPCSVVMLLMWLDRRHRWPMLGMRFGYWLLVSLLFRSRSAPGWQYFHSNSQ